MVPARRCGRRYLAAINPVPGPNGSNSGGAPMSRRSRWPTKMHECCGLYSEVASVIDRRPFPFRLLVERDRAVQESSVRSEYQLQVPMSQRLHSRSNGAAVKVPATTPVNATLDRSPLLRRLGDYAVAF